MRLKEGAAPEQPPEYPSRNPYGVASASGATSDLPPLTTMRIIALNAVSPLLPAMPSLIVLTSPGSFDVFIEDVLMSCVPAEVPVDTTAGPPAWLMLPLLVLFIVLFIAHLMGGPKGVKR
jgi:hypothetical protein